MLQGWGEEAGNASLVKAFVCHTFAGERYGPEVHPGVVGASQFEDHGDIYPCEHPQSPADHFPV